MSDFNVGDLVLVQLTPGAVGQRATVTDVYGDEYYGVKVADTGLDTGLSGKFISLIKRNEGQTVTGIVGGSQPVTGESEQSNVSDDANDGGGWLQERDDLTAEQLQELYRIGDGWDCTEEEVNDVLDDIFGEDDWTFDDLKERLGECLYNRQDDEDSDIATESPSELRQNLNEVRAELEACRGRMTSAETTISVQEAEIRRLQLRAEEAEAECARLKAAQNIDRSSWIDLPQDLSEAQRHQLAATQDMTIDVNGEQFRRWIANILLMLPKGCRHIPFDVLESLCALIPVDTEFAQRTPGSEAEDRLAARLAAQAELDKRKDAADGGPDRSAQLWRATNDKVEQWYKEHPCVSKSWDILVMNIATGRVGVLEGFSYAIDNCPGLIANVRVPGGSIEQWYTSCLIPMEHVHAGIKSVRVWKELTQPCFLTAVSSGPGITTSGPAIEVAKV